MTNDKFLKTYKSMDNYQNVRWKIMPKSKNLSNR